MPNDHTMDRRRFLKSTAAGFGAAAVGRTMLNAAEQEQPTTSPAEIKVDPDKLIWKSRNPNMAYRRLGRTNFMVSRIVQGNGGDDRLRRNLLSRGMNYFDTGRHYGNHEVELKDFLDRYRDDLWITSKSSGVAGWDKIHEDVRKLYVEAMRDYLNPTLFEELLANNPNARSDGDLLRFHIAAVEQQKKAEGKGPNLEPVGKLIAELYARKLDESLERMGIDNVDCYMMHGIEIPWIFTCTQLWDAYEKAHKAGKVKHFGFSTHKHQEPVLAAAAEANDRGPWKIDLIMPGVNPKSLNDLHEELLALKKQDVGIIAMKTTGIKNRPVDGRQKKFEKLVGDSEYNEWERSKLFMLHITEELIDACIAKMEDNEQMDKDLALPMLQMTPQAKAELRDAVYHEMGGTCSLCGTCEVNCPEHVAVADILRYHAYSIQYGDRNLAKEEMGRLGYNPADRCNDCGSCATICPSDVRITQIISELSADMAVS